MPRRSPRNDGTRSSVSSYLPISPRLLASLIAEFSEPRVVHAPRIFHGPKAYHAGHPAVRLSDEQVLTIRKMCEWYGMSAKRIAEALGMSELSVEPIASWRNRVHLDPGPRPAPEVAPRAVE